MSRKPKYDAVIIGGGIAGLAAAIRLRKKREHILIIEKEEKTGGKLDRMAWNDYHWDKGPSLFTEPELVDALFRLWNKNPRDYFHYVSLDSSCTYYFPDTNSIELSFDHQVSAQEIEQKLDRQSAEEYSNYTKQSKTLFDSVGDYFISNQKPGAKQLFSLPMLRRYPKLMKSEVRKSLHTLNKKRFSNPKLVQIFDRYGTYNGSNPYKMSGLFSMIPHLELNQGAYFPKKGMRSIVDALTQLALEIGVEIALNTQVTAKKSSNGYQIDGDLTAETPTLVCAIDHVTFYQRVLQDSRLFERYSKQERSTSGLVIYLAVREKISGLNVHNIFFSDDYQREFDALFEAKKMAQSPTFYLHVSSLINEEDAPSDGQNWFVMINTPAGVIPDQTYRQRMLDKFFKIVENQFNTNVENAVLHQDFWDCHAIQEQTGSYLGALYGAASNELTASLKRHGNTSKDYTELYFCGGTVHPGGGIPLVLRSAKIVSDLIQ